MSITELLNRPMPDGVQLGFDRRVLHFRFSNPERRNVIHHGIWDFLPLVISAAEQDDSVRVIAFSGIDASSFSAGADISEFTERRVGLQSARQYSRAVKRAELAIIHCAKPTVSFIRGWCVGGGCEIAVACDIRIGDESARMGITPAKLGIVYGLSSTSRLVQEVGPSWARYLLLTADIVDAETAVRSGLLHYAYSADEAVLKWEQLLVRLTSGAPVTLSAAKQLVARVLNGSVDDDALSEQLYDTSYLSEEYRRAREAFAGRIRPVFDDIPWPFSPQPREGDDS